MSNLSLDQALQVALSHHQAGRLQDAENLYREILAIAPQQPDALHLLGVIANQNGHYAQAVDLISQAIALLPKAPNYYSNLGNAYAQLGRLSEARLAYQQALDFNPNFPDAHFNLANIHKSAGDFTSAIFHYNQAIAARPDYVDAHHHLGSIFADQGEWAKAAAAYRCALAIRPDKPELHCDLGVALTAQCQLDEAIASYRRSLALQPTNALTHYSLGGTLFEQGCVEEALAEFRQAVDLQPDDASFHTNLLFALNLQVGGEPHAIFAEHELWNDRHGEGFWECSLPHVNQPDPARRLRIGYVSPDFRKHSVARFLEPLLTAHNHTHFEIFCYAQVVRPDEVTQRLRALTDGWRSLVGLSDEEAAALIREDRIDILVDLAGHTAHNRLPVFARQPAPIQISYLGYPNTTGLKTMTHRLTDALADPPGQTEMYHSETLWRLPQTAWCFAAPAEAPVPLPPVERNGSVTFGSFNHFSKINEPLLRLWARVLHAVPGSRLLLKAHGLASASTVQRVRQLMAGEGVAQERLDLRPANLSSADHLALYNRVDIALDTFPYHGTTTTCEALWMGVPVVTLAGTTHVSRVGVSLLTNAGVPELIASSEDEYVRLATELAHNPPRLARLRAGLQAQMKASPLMEAPCFAKNIETAYRTFWQQWCAGQTNNPSP